MQINLAMTTPRSILCPGCLIPLNQQNICFYEGVALCGCCMTAAIYDCRAKVRQTIEEKTDAKHLTCHRGLLLYTPREKPKDPPHLGTAAQ